MTALNHAVSDPLDRTQSVCMRSAGTRWYVVHCFGQSDHHVLDWLDRAKFEFYYPLVREMRLLPRKKLSHAQRRSGIPIMRPKEVPLFPRYVFTRFDIEDRGWREIFKFAGVGGMVCAGNLPAPIADAEIERWRSHEIDGAVPGKTPAKVIFELGEVVRIIDGPFAGFNGIMERTIEELDEHTRLTVLLSLFGRATKAELGIAQVEKL